MNRPRVLSAALAAGALLVLAGCASSTKAANHSSMTGSAMASSVMSSPSSSAPSTASAVNGAHNAADVTFATEMIPHHSQAVQMATLALSKATNAQVKKLATSIQAAQGPEITQMGSWLTGWSAPIPDTSMNGMSGMNHGPGMISDADMKQLGLTTGRAFDRLWLQMMTRHHQGALTMAQTELSAGQNSDAKALAKTIIASQSAQITQMTALLGTL